MSGRGGGGEGRMDVFSYIKTYLFDALINMLYLKFECSVHRVSFIFYLKFECGVHRVFFIFISNLNVAFIEFVSFLITDHP